MKAHEVVTRSPMSFGGGVLIAFVALFMVAPVEDLMLKAFDGMRPVVIKWRVTEARTEGQDVVLSGDMVKQRACAYVPPTVARDPHGQNYIVHSESRTAGITWAASDEPQKWGPWTVRGAAGKVLEFSNLYVCGERKVIVHLGSYVP